MRCAALTVPEIVTLLRRALPVVGLAAPDELLEQIAIYANGDARQAYNTLEAAAAASPGGALTEAAVQDAMQRKVLLYDKGGEEHFNLISALHKSVRSSDVDAALYWLARMLEAGEDRLYIARRLIRMAIEDIGLADPRALEQAVAAMQAVHFLGIPEGDLALAQAAIYLSRGAEIRRRLPRPGRGAARTWSSTIAEPVPMNLRNAVTRSMKEWGYGEGYQHAHQFEDAVAGYGVPAALAGRPAILLPHRPRHGKAHRRAAGRDPPAERREAAVNRGWRPGEFHRLATQRLACKMLLYTRRKNTMTRFGLRAGLVLGSALAFSAWGQSTPSGQISQGGKQVARRDHSWQRENLRERRKQRRQGRG